MTVAAKHTPGPWAISERQGHECYGKNAIECLLHPGKNGIVNGNAFCIVSLGGDGATLVAPEAVRANARLIKSAPDMLYALEGALSYMEEAEKLLLVGDEGCHWPVELVRAAIRAAKGED